MTEVYGTAGAPHQGESVAHRSGEEPIQLRRLQTLPRRDEAAPIAGDLEHGEGLGDQRDVDELPVGDGRRQRREGLDDQRDVEVLICADPDGRGERRERLGGEPHGDEAVDPGGSEVGEQLRHQRRRDSERHRRPQRGDDLGHLGGSQPRRADDGGQRGEALSGEGHDQSRRADDGRERGSELGDEGWRADGLGAANDGDLGIEGGDALGGEPHRDIAVDVRRSERGERLGDEGDSDVARQVGEREWSRRLGGEPRRDELLAHIGVEGGEALSGEPRLDKLNTDPERVERGEALSGERRRQSRWADDGIKRRRRLGGERRRDVDGEGRGEVGDELRHERRRDELLADVGREGGKDLGDEARGDRPRQV